MATAIQSIGLFIVVVMVVVYGVVCLDYFLNKTAILQHRAKAVAGELENKEKKMSNSRER